MITPAFGILVSAVLVFLLSILFHFERSRGIRILPGLRGSFDKLVERGERVTAHLFRYVGRDMLRQTIHYVFHYLLSGILKLTRGAEQKLSGALSLNRSMARKHNNGVRTETNKFDEIAEHKQAMALTDAEKKKKRRQELEG